MKNDKFFGVYAKFDAKLILLQIICNQLIFYCGLTVLFILFDTSFGVNLHSGQYFHYSVFNSDHIYGMISMMSSLFNIGLVIAGLFFVTEKYF